MTTARNNPCFPTSSWQRLRALSGFQAQPATWRVSMVAVMIGAAAMVFSCSKPDDPSDIVDAWYTPDDDKYVITAEVPGAGKDDVTLEVHDNVLTLRGEKRSEREEKKEQVRYVERSYGSFSRSFTLPSNADANRVTADFKDGVLRVEVPKAAEAKPKVISIR